MRVPVAALLLGSCNLLFCEGAPRRVPDSSAATASKKGPAARTKSSAVASKDQKSPAAASSSDGARSKLTTMWETKMHKLHHSTEDVKASTTTSKKPVSVSADYFKSRILTCERIAAFRDFLLGILSGVALDGLSGMLQSLARITVVVMIGRYLYTMWCYRDAQEPQHIYAYLEKDMTSKKMTFSQDELDGYYRRKQTFVFLNFLGGVFVGIAVCGPSRDLRQFGILWLAHKTANFLENIKKDSITYNSSRDLRHFAVYGIAYCLGIFGGKWRQRV